MFTTEKRRGRGDGAFTAIELLLGLSLAVLLVGCLAPLLISLEKTGVEAADKSVQMVQARVAMARFERDTRCATASSCPFPVTAPVLEATRTRLVLFAAANSGGPALLVAWEISGGALMRRWGLCPALRPAAITTSLFRDNKTMLEGVARGSVLSYTVGGREVAPPLSSAQLAGLTEVALHLVVTPAKTRGVEVTSVRGRVGR